MKIWIDDVRPAPEGYEWCKSVNQAIYIIEAFICLREGNSKGCIHLFETAQFHGFEGSEECLFDHRISLIDIDHDAGEYACDGGDYIKLLEWLEKYNLSYPIRIHSMNPVGVENMRRIIQRNGWKEIR